MAAGPSFFLLKSLVFLACFCTDATHVIPGTLGAKGPSSGFNDDGGRLSGKIGRDVGLVNGKSKHDNGNRYFDSSSTPDLPEPYFEATPPRNVSALIGKTAFLTCVVRNLGKAKSVTWIRHRDVHVLTVGEYTYTTDERFTARHNRATDEWVLVIKYVQERDAGVYECQIPTATSKAYPVQLNIVVPHVRIQGAPDIHVNQGSAINLTCIISYSPEPPAFVFWYRGNKVVAYDTAANAGRRIEVLTEQRGRGETRSHLVIEDARPDVDSGNYTCKPSIARPASIKVHVLENDFPGALQVSSCPPSHPNLLRLSLFVTAPLFLVAHRLSPAGSANS